MDVLSSALVITLLFTGTLGQSGTELIIGVLWETTIIADITHLQRSLRLMAEMSNTTSLEFYNVTGMTQNKLEQLVCTEASAGTLIFLSALSCYQSAVLHDISDRQRVSVVAVDTECHFQDTVPTYLTYTNQQFSIANVVADLISYENLGEIAILYDSASGKDFDEIMDAIDNLNTTIRAFKLPGTGNIDSTLGTLVQSLSYPRHMVLLCTIRCQLNVLQQVNYYDQLNKVQAQFKFGDRWLVVAESFQIPSLETVIGEIDNVAIIIPKSPREKSIESIIEEAFSYTLQTIPLTKNASTIPQVQTTPASCVKYDNTVSTLLTLQMLNEHTSCLSCDAFDIATVMYGELGRYTTVVGSWSRQGLAMDHKTFPNLNYGLNGRELLVSTNLWKPFVMEAPESSAIPYEGLTMELLIDLARSSNFTYTVILPPDKGWGGLDNGSWTGLVGQLERKEVDMVVAPLSIQTVREAVMDFTDPYYSEYLTVLAKLPDPDATKWSLYISPFKWQVWLSIAGSIPIVGCIVWAVTCLSPHYMYYRQKNGLSQLDNAVFYMFGALFTQGGIHLPTAQSGRFVVGFWWMYCIVLVATYSGNLIAFLTVTLSQLPFNTLENMVQQDSIKYGMMSQTASYNEFQASHDDIIARAWKNMVEFAEDDPRIFATDHSVHIDRVLNGGYAYINDRTGFEVEMSKYCQIQMIKDTFVPVPYGVGLQKNSAYNNYFSAAVRKVIEGGLINKWKAKWWPRQSFCARGLVTEAKSVTLKDVQGAYYVMGMLLSVAFITLSIEAALNAIYRNSQKKEETKKVEAVAPTPTAEELRDLSIWGVSRQVGYDAPESVGVRDIYTNKEPMVDLFGRSS